MLWISLALVASLALAVFCAVLLARAPAPQRVAEVESMKKALERRLRESAEFHL